MHYILSIPLTIILTLSGCDAANSDIANFVETADQIAQSPARAEALCPELQEPHRASCVLLALDHRRSQSWMASNRQLCEQITRASKSECWFRVAEQSLDPDDCALTAAFKEDCFAHILNNQLQQRFPLRSSSPSWDTLLKFSNTLTGLSFADPKIKLTILTRHWLEGPQTLPIQLCDQHPDPDFCSLSALRIYTDRLRSARDKGHFKCDALSPSLQHSESPLLLDVWSSFREDLCSP